MVGRTTIEGVSREELLEALAGFLNLDDGDTPYWYTGKPAEIMEAATDVYYRARGWK